MRLHELEVTAFGPFPETVRVDFDDLSAAGLFLLSGPTGAGKSSILDAVCFALYGDVPGDRASAKRLRCDLSAPNTPPRVVLETTLSGRRFRLDRSPAWSRPKKRGTGLTTEQARVVVSERLDGEWTPLTTRLDEAGHLVTRLVGMNLAQFCQIALLPQGRFQAFLRARSEERHALLQQVFRTGRFDDVERWLREHRLALRRASLEHEGRVLDLVSRVSEVSGRDAPESGADTPPELVDWADRVTRLLAEHAEEADRLLLDAEATAQTAETDLAAGVELEDRRGRHRAAAQEWQHLEARRGEVRGWRTRRDAADRARPVVVLHEGWREAAQAVDAAQEHLDAATGRLHALAPDLEGMAEEDLAAHRRDCIAVLSRVEQLRPVADRLLDLRASRSEVEAQVATLDESIAGLRIERDLLETRLFAIREALDHARRTREALPDRAQSLAELRARVASAHRLVELEASLVAAEADHRATQTDLNLAKERWLDLRERRLDGMAAEMARDLAVGADCPVCGSTDHPRPASPVVGAPDAGAEQEARRAVDDLEGVALARSDRVRTLTSEVAAAAGAAGADLDELTSSATQLAAEVRELEASAATLPDLALREEQAEEDLRALDARVANKQEESTTAGRTLDRLTTRIDESEALLRDLLEETGAESLGALEEHHRRLEGALDTCLTAGAELAQARRAAETARVRLEDAVGRAGFATVEEAVGAGLTPEELARLDERLHRDHADRARVGALLEDPALAEAASAPDPDVPRLREEAARLQRLHAEARSRQHGLRSRRDRAAALLTDLRAAEAQWRPLRDDLELATGLSALVEGKSADNRLQMRLSAFVLAHRLGQVVEAANLRLSTMSGQRYALEHTGRRGAGESRGGLSLLVRDEWSGEDRDPATLSGGETFVVSLALALGLADVITQEAGGAELDTLFVDEGFGALDAETLDDVLDTLDTLRDGGRTVGVVSHVAEMQTRIPTQLRVHKGRSGSRVSQVSG